MTGREQQAGRYWPVEPAPPGAGPAAFLHVTSRGGSEFIVPRPEDPDGRPAQLAGLFDIFPELRALDAVITACSNLAHSTADLAVKTSATISGLAARVRALENTGRPVPVPLDGCTCGGIGDTGSHRPGCPWGRS
jgi:hypothetical protein